MIALAAAAGMAATSCDQVDAIATPSPSSAVTTPHTHLSGPPAGAPYRRDMIAGGRRTLAKYLPMERQCARHIDISCLGALMDVETSILALNEDDSKYTVPPELQDPDTGVRHFLTISIRGVRTAIDGVIEQDGARVETGIAQAQSVAGELTTVLDKLGATAS